MNSVERFGPQPHELGRAPSLARLLTPEEILIYTVRIHPLRGWWLLLLALGCMGASYEWPLAVLACPLFFGLWYLPLHTNEIAVTDDRLLLRTGWLKLHLEAVEDHNILRWEMTQNVLGSLFNCGTVQVRFREAASTREVYLHWVHKPVRLLEALQALQDERYRESA